MDIAAYKKPINSEWVTDYILWTFLEATCLLAGCNPVSVKVFYDVLLAHDPLIAKIYRQMKDAARMENLVTVPPCSKEKTYSETGHKYDLRATPKAFIVWAISSGYEIPHALTSLVPELNTSTLMKRQAEAPLEFSCATWTIKAQEIGEQYIARHKKGDLFPTQKDVCDHIEVQMRGQKIYGPQGRPLSANTISRDAIQGEWWKKNRPR